MYPGIPEYFSPRGRGMYPYLTGSASWFLLTMLTEVYGVKGSLGDLVLEPKLTREQFGSDGTAIVHTLFADKKLQISYKNPQYLPYGDYVISKITANDVPILEDGNEQRVSFTVEQLSSFTDQINLDVYLEVGNK
jgi:cellobiose phosphorylase